MDGVPLSMKSTILGKKQQRTIQTPSYLEISFSTNCLACRGEQQTSCLFQGSVHGSEDSDDGIVAQDSVMVLPCEIHRHEILWRRSAD
eukprot:scaffold38450_cov43-Prasinocladus_malaysianus.AAC.2